METTPRLGLPLLVAGQVQKEVFHNEALALVDLLIGGTIDGEPIATPPPSPALGSFYRISSAGTSGAFAGHEGALAGWSAGGWRFVTPVEGMRLTDRTSGLEVCFRGGAWTNGSVQAREVIVDGIRVVGAQAAAVADPTGGATVDVQARAALAQILTALRDHGLIAD